MLSGLRAEWGMLPHAAYPELLTGKVLRSLRTGCRQAERVQDKELVRQCTQAIAAAHDLAQLMKASSAIRKVADYNPEILVKFAHTHRFTLNNVEITEAHQWPERGKVWATSIESAWRQLDA